MKKFYAPFANLLFLPCFLLFTTSASAQLVSAGEYFSTAKCGPCDNVFSWGANWDGHLGDSTLIDRYSPGVVHDLSGVTAISAGAYFTISLRSDSTVWAWGPNWDGYIGDGTYIDRLEPVKTNLLTGIKAIAAGGYHSLALKSDGTVWSWGYNGYGELGDSTTIERISPVQVKGLSNVIAISAGEYHSMALKSDGTVWTWGRNSNGQLGDSTTVGKIYRVQVKNLTGVAKISAGYDFSLALKSDGTLWSWGYNGNGRLGDGTTVQKIYRVQVSVLGNSVSSMDGGQDFALAIKTDGTVWGWGYNGYGQLGDNTYNQSSIPVQTLGGMANAISVSAGGYHSLAMKSDGSVWAWGYNYEGQAGTGINNNEYILPERTLYLCPAQDTDVDIDLPAACSQYDTIPAGGNDPKSLVIRNLGCDTLIISNVTSSNSNFTVDYFPSAIAPLDSAEVVIAFTPPPAPGSYSATITVFNNDADTTFCVWGVAVPPPVIVTQPASFNESLACNTSTNDTLLIINTGNSDLDWNIAGAFPYDSTIYVQYFASDVTTTHSFPDIPSTDSLFLTVTIAGDYDSGSEYADVYVDGTFIETIPDGNLLDQPIVRNYAFGGAQTAAWIADGQVVVTIDNSSSVNDFGTTDYHIVTLSVNGSLPGWLTAAPYQGTTPLNDTTLVVLNLNATSIQAGTYNTYIYVFSNDPSSPIDSTSISLTVTGAPEITLSDTCLAFGSQVIVGTAMEDSVLITNTGCDTLKINNVVSSDGVFTVTPTSKNILVGQSAYFKVTFTPPVVASYTGTLTFDSNVPDTAVCLTGSGISSLALSMPLAAGDDHSLAICSTCNDGFAWGYNGNGQLGDSTTIQKLTYVLPKVTDISAVAAGGSHSLGLRNNGTVWAWGYNGNGQLGDATYVQRIKPVQVSGLTGTYISVAAGQSHSMALKGNGSVLAWGSNGNGQLGDNSTLGKNAPVQVSGLTGVIAISAGQNHSMALKSDSTVWTWGYNGNGQLGDGTTVQKLTPVQVSGLTGIIAIEAGYNYSIALKSDGTVWAWGYNGNGQLGDNTTIQRLSPVQVSGLTTATAIAAGYLHTLALKSDGTLWAWGYNGYNQLGDNTSSQRLTPVQVHGIGNIGFLTGVTVVAAGEYHTLAMQGDSVVLAWGRNVNGQLGDGTTIQRSTPVLTKDVCPVNQFDKTCLNYGSQFVGTTVQDSVKLTNTSCALLQVSNIVSSSGSFTVTPTSVNLTYAQSAYIKVTFSPAAVATYTGTLTFSSNLPDTTVCLTGTGISSLPLSVPLAAGGNHSLGLCNLCDEGFAWGLNGNGQLGDSTTTNKQTRTLVKLPEINSVASGGSHSLGLKNNGSIWAWGYNGYGQIGDATYIQKLEPVQVSGLTGTNIAVAAGGNHSVALKGNGTVWTWGYNGNGQLGDGTTTSRNTPMQVSGLTGIIAIAAGQNHSMALKSDSTVWTWGYNGNGQLGNNTTIQSLSPVQASGLTGIIAIAGGANHSIALKSDSTVWAWGRNANYQLGDNTNTQRLTPVQVHGPGNVGFLTGITALALGEHHSVALKGDSTVWAWGYNGNGRLGDNTGTQRTTPVQVHGPGNIGFLTQVTAIAAGYDHTAAMKSDETFWGWGYNGYGQIGDGTTVQKLTPVQTKYICPSKQFDINIPLTELCTKYDTLILGNNAPQTFKVYNWGCDTLQITNVTSSSSEFTVTSFPAKISPIDSAIITISLTPTITGSVTTTISVADNDPDPDTTFCLEGVVIPAPTISVTPTSMSYTLACCADTTVPLVISNSGGSDLDWSLSKNNNKTLGFNGSNSYVQMNNSADFDVNRLTIEAWVYSDNYNQNGHIFEKGPVNSQYSLFFEGTNLCFRTYPTIGGYDNQYLNSVGIGITNGQWHHIAATFDGSFKRIYVDGIEKGSVSYTKTFRTGQLGEIIGAYGGTGSHSYFYNGNISEVRVWDHARTQQQIADNMNHHISPLESGLVAAYRLSEGSGTVLYDMTPNGNNGTSTNTSWVDIENPISFPQGFSATPVSGTVDNGIGDKDTIDVTFNSCGLTIGTYTTQIVIYSNDPSSTKDTIPLTLKVVGAPETNAFLADSIGNCLDMDSIMAFTTSIDTISIFNTGCDTLFIDSLIYSSGAFSTFYSADTILTGDTGIVVVQFAPSFSVAVTTTVTGTVTVYTNDLDPVICLHGEVFPYPIISTVPTSYSVTLACCDSTTLPLQIHNTGGSDLNFTVSNIGGLPNPTYDFLIVDHGKNKNSFAGYVTNTSNETTFSSMATSQLITNRVIYFEPDWSNYSNLTNNMANLSSYVNQGGIAVINIAGNSGNANNVDPFGTDYSRATTSNAEIFNLPAHPYLTGSPYGGNVLTTGNFNNWSSTDHGTLTNYPSGSQVVLSSVNGTTWIEYPWGNGRVILTTLTYRWGSSPDVAVDNLVDYAYYLAQNSGAGWLSATPTSGTTAPASFSTLGVKFKSCGLTVGTYTTNIIVNSNDPLNAKDSIPCSLTVIGTPKIETTKTCMYLDSIIEFSTNKDSLYIKNTGCDVLTVTNITKQTSLFTVNTTTFTILPGDSAKLRVTFSPVAPGSFKDTLAILSNTTTKEICLSGKAFAKPVQCHSPNSYTVQFTVCEDSIMDTLAICNTGAGNLNYNLWSPYGRSSVFDGSNDYISTPLNIDQSATSPGLTMSAWVYPTSVAGGYHHVLSTDNGGYDWSILKIGNLWYVFTGENVRSSGFTVDLNQWQHIAAVFIPGTGINVYKNGILSNIPFIDYDASDNAVYIGRNPGFGEYFDGRIDEARVYSKQLTQTEIIASMTKNLVGNESGLQGYWHFDDSTATDFSVNTNNGTLNGGTLITVPNISFIPAATGTVTPSGTYSVQVKFKKEGLASGTTIFPIYLNSNDPLNAVDTVNVTFNIDAVPPAPTAGSNSPVCEGNNLSLTASIIPGATYSWTGPDNFTSSLQNPVITGAGTAAAGTYSVTAAISGCPIGASGTTTVVVNTAPAVPVAGSHATICSGSLLTLSSSTVAGATYAWTGPNSYTSTTQNPSISGVTTAASGTYSVTATVPGCPATSPGTTTALVYQTPGAPTASSNSPVCAGNNLSLSASTISGVIYAWTGPNSFTNTAQNPDISPATVAATGTYSVSATENGCTGPKGTTAVIVNPQPSAPSAGSNSTVCSGLTLSLTAGNIASATYSWNGPNGFTSAIQNPTIASVTTAASGAYSVTATVPGCPTSGAGTTTVAINQTPVAPIAASNSPICVGNDLSLTASTISGVTYLWTGPASFTSTLQDPVITSASVTATGTYSVAATIGGCTGPKGTTLAIVNPPPSAPVVTSNSTVCSGNTLTLFANTISGATYSWTGPASFTSSLEDPTITGVATSNAGTYSVTATVGGCPTSPVGTGTVVVNQSPDAPSPVTSNSPVCSGQTLSLAAGTVSGATYSWTGPLSFTSTTQDPTIASVPTTRAGTYSVTAIVGGCPSPAGTVSVTINQTPSAPSASSNSPICSGFTLSLNGGTVAGATYAWTGPLSFTSTSEDPSIAGVSTANAGTYSVTVMVNGCIGAAGTTSVVVNDSPSSPSAGSNTPVCSGQTLSLNATTVSGAAYSWSGPNGFTSAAQNPNIPSVTTLANGTYSVSAVVAGCPPSAPGTTSVTINQTPAAPVAASNSPVCAGTTLSLTASTISGATYAWTGPGSYTDAAQDPVISSVATANAGTYSVTATVNGCTGPNGTTAVAISAPPSVPTAGNNSTICSGQTLSLSASTVSGATYSWTGPNSFTSVLQNPTIAAATIAANGTYSVTATTPGCPPSAAGTTTETINQTPSAPVASANSPICVGFTLSLTASSAGTTYSWNGPASFTSSTQDPTIAGVTTANAGTYSVSATTLGCTGPQGTATVVVNTIPAAPTAADQNACFGGTIPDLTAAGSNIQWYDNLGSPAGSGSSFATGQTAAATYTYTATQAVNGCTSPSATVILTINALPVTPVASSDAAICYGAPAPSFTATESNLTWYNSVGGIVGTGSPFTPAQTAPGVYTYYVTQTNTVTTCESLQDSVKFTINSIAPPVAPDVAVCAGNPVPPLVATGTSIEWYDVTQAPVFSGSPFNTGMTAVGTYTFYVTQTNTVTTCSSPKDTVFLYISTQPTAAPVIANDDACFGTTIPNLVATSGTIINWYDDAALTNEVFSGNPYNTGLTAVGNYTFFAADSTPGCPEGPSAPVVLVINPLPATLVVNDTATCFGSTTPDLITSGNNIQWYNTSLAVVSVNDTFASGQTAVGTYTYYVTQTNTVTGCESVRVSVHLTINSLPSTPTALDTIVCSAAVIPSLVSTGANVQWYDTSGAFVFTGNSYATGQTTAGIHTYFVTQKDAVTGCESNTDTSVLVIMQSPPIPVANNVAVCIGNPIPSLTSTGTDVKWYSDAALTNLVQTGNTYNTGQTAIGVYTYYVTDSLTGCRSIASDSVSLMINALPSKPTAANATVCYGAATTLTATGTNLQWYSDAALINMVGTGNPFNTGLTNAGTSTYYVVDFAAGCGNSISDTAMITINPVPLVTANTYSTAIVQNGSITLTAYNAISYSWSPSAGLSAATGQSVVASPTVTTTYTVTGANSFGCTSSITILVVVNPLGVVSFTDPVQDVNIYPNPAMGSFTLEFNSTVETPIDIYMLNMLGDKVRIMQGDASQGGGLMKHTYKIDTSTLTEGVYNVEIVTAQGTVNRRVVLFRQP